MATVEVMPVRVARAAALAVALELGENKKRFGLQHKGHLSQKMSFLS